MLLNDIYEEIKILEKNNFRENQEIKRLKYKIEDLEIMRNERGKAECPPHITQSIRSYINNIIICEKSIEINDEKSGNLHALIRNNEYETK